MSGFSTDWLALREPVDHRSRDPALVSSLASCLEGREVVRAVDLGCGSGSNFRALATHLPGQQHWRLVDHDPALLEAARMLIAAWKTEHGRDDIDVVFEAADLQTGLDEALADAFDLVTAAALFDLVSVDWIDRFVARLAAHRCAFYTALTYNGVMRWSPAHPADEAIVAAFNAHQRQDKGFGAAAGPDATDHLHRRLEEAGFQVTIASSPWLLHQSDQPLIMANAEGIAQAVSETGAVPEPELTDWRETRKEVQSCEIGHSDLLAHP